VTMKVHVLRFLSGFCNRSGTKLESCR